MPGTKPLDSFFSDTEKTLLASTLNSDSFRTENYARAIQTWPKDVAIWPFLNSFSAQKNFIKYIGTIDRAKNNPYVKKNRDWVCEDFALQFYLQFSSFDVPLNPPLFASKDAYEPSDQIRLTPQRADPKLRMPVYYVSIDKNDDLSWGHAIIAIQVGTDPTKFESFYFLEPQGDWHPNLGNPGFPVNSVIGIYQELTIGTEDYADYPIARFNVDKQGMIKACPNLSQFSPCTN